MSVDIIHLKYGLFLKRRFLPLFLTQFLGAFNDNLLRNGLIVMIAFAAEKGVALPVDKPAVLVTICSALLILPFILFSSLAGQLADKLPKAKMVIFTKTAEIFIMLGAFYGFYHQDVILLMVLLFLSGLQSTFFGPLKFSILPEQLSEGELLAGNGFISAGSHLGILSGLIAGAILVAYPHNIIGFVAIAVSIAGLTVSLFIPRDEAASPGTHVHYNLWESTKEMLGFASSSKVLLHSIMGISWFLLMGSVIMTQFANFSREILHADNEVYTALLTMFSIGIAIGATLADQILKGEVTAKLSPWALLGLSVFLLSMVFTSPPPIHDGLIGLEEFFFNPYHWPMILSVILMAISGGIYMVPLYAMLQTHSKSKYRSRVIAASNMIDSLFMTFAAAVSALLLHFGFSINDLFLLLAAANLGVFLYARKLTSADYKASSSS